MVFFLKSKSGGGGDFVFEIQRPWSRKVVQGEKKIEIRSYIFPKNLTGKSIEVLETPRSTLGSGVPDVVDPESEEGENYRVIGKMVLSGFKEYKNAAEFNADADLHLAVDSEFQFQKGKPCYGWIIKSAECYDLPKPCPIIQREHRSIFKVLEKLPEVQC